MSTYTINAKNELMTEINSLPKNLIKDVLEFVCFIKVKKSINPTQSYFWTKHWQQMEEEADNEIKKDKLKVYKSIKELKKAMGD